MIEVELPDGTIAEFPDGTSPDVMRSALQKRFSAPVNPPSDQAVPPAQLAELSQLTQGAGMQDERSTLGAIGHGVDSAMRGAADAMSFGFADELSALGQAATGLGGDFGDYSRNLSRERITQKVRDNYNPYSSNAGRVAGALGTGLGLAKSGASFAGRAIDKGSNLARVAGASAVDGLLLGGAQGFGSGEGLSDRVSQAKKGATTGAVVGAAVPLAISGISAGVRKAVSPFASNAERQAAVDVLSREGVPLSAGQKTGSKALQYFEAENGGNRIAQMLDDQGEAFTNAAMRRAGGSGRATSDNMADMARRIGQGFDNVSSRNALKLDRQIITDFNKATQEYARVLPTEQKGIYQALRHDIAERFKAGKGIMSGNDYQTVRSRLSRMAQSYKNSDGEFSSAIRGLRNALDEGMERSITPQDAGVWSELRRQYGNMKVLERAANGGGEDAAMGIISPARLRMAASSGNRGGYARGQGDFAELAKAGQAAMTPLPNSGTAGRLKAQSLVSLAPTLLGAGAGGAYGAQSGGWQGGLLGAMAGAAAPRVAGRLALSAPMQRYLANQAMTTPLTAETRGLLNMLMNTNSASIQRRLPSGG